ncbi:MAG: signal peptidase II [Solirubrobacterales bacterium]
MTRWFALVALLLGLDQAAKALVQHDMALGESIPLIPGLFHLTYVQNHGAAFGILQGYDGVFFLCGTAVAAAAVWFGFRYRQHGALVNTLALITAGAIGNLIDRARLGAVVDFFDFRIWPVFNLADCWIVVGAGLLFYFLVLRQPVEEESR